MECFSLKAKLCKSLLSRWELMTSMTSLQSLLWLGLALLAMQIALGGWVSTNYAALACGAYPLCQGELIPALDMKHGFTLWRHLGMTAAGDYLPFSALVAIHWVHRTFAYVVVALLAWLAHRALRLRGLQSTARALLLMIFIQLCTGIATVLFNWPLSLAVLHNGGAALLVLLLVVLNYRLSLSGRELHIEPRSSLSPV